MLKNFTYLIGAEASYHSLPTIKDFNERLKTYKSIFDHRSFKTDIIPGLNVNLRAQVKKYTDDLMWLIGEISDHASVDTFARKLFLTRKTEEYNFLKFLVGEFLTYEQLVKGLDKRYDAFFASVLKLSSTNQVEFPSNIRFISWNYDKQIEFSAAQFKPQSQNLEEEINLFPRRGNQDNPINSFSVYKLNGTIGGVIEKDNFSPWQFNPLEIGSKLNEDDIMHLRLKSLARHYQYQSLQTFNSSIHYSWENETVSNSIREKAIESTLNTDILIVIGYSFPTFNRKLDSMILNQMNNRLQKIYIQDPNAEAVKQKLESLLSSKKDIITLTNAEEFYIPFEFTS